MNKTLTLGLAGLGTVGGGLVRLLTENAEEIRSRCGCGFRLKTVAVRNPDRKRELPEGVLLTTDPQTLADDPDIDVIIELMGGIDAPKKLIAKSLENGKQVITANKALLAEEGASLFQMAEEKGATLLYEASVAGGISDLCRAGLPPRRPPARRFRPRLLPGGRGGGRRTGPRGGGRGGAP